MFLIFLGLIVVVAFLLIVVIMVQNPKGGGLSSSFGGSQQLGGVQKTTDFLDKSTWTLGGILIALILLSSLAFSGSGTNGSKVLGDEDVNVPTQTTIPATPQATPAEAQTPAQTEETSK